jgi:GNAT superfamily N-acetyltransferase
LTRKLQPGQFSEIESLFDDLIELRKGTSHPLSENAKTSIKKAQAEGKLEFIVEYDGTQPIGFVMFRRSSINIFHIDGSVENAREIERRLFDRVFKELSERSDYIMTGGPSINPELSDYIVEQGFRMFKRTEMTISREKIDSFAAPTLPEGYRFETYTPEMREEIAEMMYDANVGEFDDGLFPEFYSSKDAVVGLYKLLEGVGCQPYTKVILKDTEYVAACFVTKQADNSAIIADMAVSKGHRRIGLGRAIIMYALTRMTREMEALEKVKLEVTKGNPARHLYDLLGFEVEKETPSYLWDKD